MKGCRQQLVIHVLQVRLQNQHISTGQQSEFKAIYTSNLSLGVMWVSDTFNCNYGGNHPFTGCQTPTTSSLCRALLSSR